jgi:4-hydroxy-tetrahydrodipicolinate reductase
VAAAEARQIPLTIFGSTGRMGQSLIRALRGDARFQLIGATASAGSARLGQDAALEGPPSGVSIGADVDAGLQGAQVALDFSQAAASARHAAACRQAGVPLLVGVTGLDAAAHTALQDAARTIPVLIAPNTSVGVSTLLKLAQAAAKALGEGFDVEIAEAHHQGKRDAPSGTALALGEAVARQRGRSLKEVAVFERHGREAARQAGSIGFAVLRAGDIVGEHTVVFAAAGERVELTHRATDRQIFARGALRAAAWLREQRPGLYAMHHVLGI